LKPSIVDRAWRWLRRHRGLIAVVLVAFGVRLAWNLLVHPPGNFIDAFFPYGTHYFVGLLKLAFGVKNYAAVGVAYASLGAAVAGFSYAIAARLSRHPWVPRLAGAVAAIHFVHISLGGYVLSEIPAAFCVTAVAYLTVRLADDGKARHAWLLGLMVGIGAAVRPQLLMSLPFFGLFWLWRRKQLRGIRFGHLLRAAIPMALILAFSAKRVEHHTGQWLSLVSTNGPLNYAFGRCHNSGMESYTGKKPGTGERSMFGPPPYYLLRERETKRPDSWVRLNPAMGYDLKFRGRMWDKEPLGKLADECIAKTGWSGQLRYAATHVLLLWGYNVTWPDSAQPKFREYIRIAHDVNVVTLMPPAIFAMFLAFRKRWARFGLIALHLWALTVVAILYFGDTRFRAPYDGLAIVLAAEVVIHFGRRFLGWLTTLPGRSLKPG
jgi:hypothetical protein